MATNPVRQMRLGVDTGGTFTDFVLVDGDRVHTLKHPATPGAPAESFVEGLQVLLRRVGARPADVGFICHGTTIATNTVIERKGARTGLLVTAGFRDVLNIERLRLPNPTDLMAERPVPLVRRRWVRPVDGRMSAAGEEVRPLDIAAVTAAAELLEAEDVEAIAVVFMNAYRSPHHERQAGAAIERSAPGRFVSLSSDVWPQMREYERTLLTVINAYVGTKMRGYFGAVDIGLAQDSIEAPLLVMRSNGGVTNVKGAMSRPVDTLLSGPASGAVGARWVAERAGFDRIMALDMGGTSADVSVIDREVPYSTEGQVGDFPIIMPAVEVKSIGAGGGSIAWLDGAGILKVGPRSAGAKPGPACYDLGGAEPTVTDAYVTVGVLDPDRFVGGTLRLSRERAAEAILRIAEPLGLDVARGGEAILRVATANMYAALLALVAQKGIDPRDFALLLFGGAGPTHGFLLAEEIGIGRVVVPPTPGVLSALGCLVADLRHDLIRAVVRHLRPGDIGVTEAVASAFLDLDRQARDWIQTEGARAMTVDLVHSGDLRYVGQSFELTVPLVGSQFTADEFIERFHARHEQLYGHADRAAAVELINVRTTVVGRAAPVSLPSPTRRVAVVATPHGARRTFQKGEWVETPVYLRDDLGVGTTFHGPAIVEQYDCTTFVPDGYDVRVDQHGNLVGEVVER